MREEVEFLRAQVAALRDELAEERSARARAITRRRLLTGLAGVGAAGAAGVASATPAAAANGDPLVVGAETSATATTTLQHSSSSGDPGLRVRSSGDIALFASTEPAATPPTSTNTAWAIYARAGGDALVSNAIGALADDGFGVEAINFSDNFPAAAGTNGGSGPGIGAMSIGHGPQLVLAREGSATSGAPTSWAEAGSIRFDGAGDLWLCLATGTPGTWTRLLREDTAPGRTIPITPIRALDTRATGGRVSGAPAIPGQRKGPLKGGESITLDLAGVAPIPPTASGVVGNATVITPSGNGYLRILPAGASVPASSFNFTSGTTIANGFTSALTPTGLRATAPISPAITYHLVIDIAAYIT